MKIAISSLPNNPWWGNGIIGYKDNPAMKDGIIPNQDLLIREHTNLLDTIVNNKLEIVEFPFPDELENTNFGHDFVFIRDTFISDLNGRVLLLNFSQKNRDSETKIIADYLEKLDYRISELPIHNNVFAEGGEFYYCPNDKLLFSGANRNSVRGAEEVASFLNVNELILIETKAFHLDTVFTTVLDNNGSLCAVIVCEELISKKSFDYLNQFVNAHNKKIFNIPTQDSIGFNNNIGSLAVNNLSAPGLLISSSKFSNPLLIKELNKINIKLEISPVSQFQLSGGSVHCLTNEL